MIIEILQLVDMLLNREIHLLTGFFIIFTIFPAYLTRRQSKMYTIKHNAISLDVTVIVPVHLEDYDTFEKCINSISSQKPKQLIVSIDSNDQKLINIAIRHGAEIIKYHTRVGKRRALADAWLQAQNDIIVHIDSDTILDNDCIKEVTKPFINNPKIVGVSTEHTCTNGGSIISYILSCSIELSRSVNEKALDGNLIVVDGRCGAWRREFLLDIRKDFLNEYWMSIKCEIGDDRFLSREAIKRGFNTVHKDSAKIYTSAPDSFVKFLKQQIRWRRSGTKFWIKDLKDSIYPTKLYAFKCFTYYLSPLVFPLVVILDTFFFKKLAFEILSQWEISIIILIIGSTLVTILRQIIYFGRVLFPRYIVLQALIGLFVMLPISIYGALTMKRQDLWMTR